MSRKTMALIDFDGTLIHEDSLSFIMKKERWQLHPSVLAAGVRLALVMALHRDTLPARSRFKYRILRCWNSLPDEKKADYAACLRAACNTDLIAEIAGGKYDLVVIASASETGLIRSVLDGVLEVDEVIANDASALPEDENAFRTCWGSEKVRRINESLQDLTQYSIMVYTDSESDRPIMDLADRVMLVKG